MHHEGIFSQSLFSGSAMGDVGAVPSRQPITELSQFAQEFGLLPDAGTLQRKGVTHFVREESPSGAVFTFYAGTEEAAVPPFRAYRRPQGPVAPSAKGGGASAAYEPGDGLLPTATAPASNGQPKWLPWVLLGGGLLVAGGIVYASAKKPVRRNRRRRKAR